MRDLTGLRAGSLTRVSTAEQALHGSSLEDQSRENLAFIERRGMIFVKEYVEDEGISGLAAERPDVDAMIADFFAGRLDVAVIHRIDRGWRGLRYMLNTIHVIEKEAGGLVLSATQDYDPSTPDGRFLRHMLGANAERERDVIVANTSRGIKSAARNGYWPGGATPFGLARHRPEGERHTTVVLDESEAETIRAAASLVLDADLTPSEAAERLNALGHRTRKGNRWDGTRVRRVLSAHYLSGTFTWAREGDAFAIPIPAILTPDTHAALPAALDRVPRQSRAAWKDYPLTKRIASPCGSHYRGARAAYDGVRRYGCASRRSGCGCPNLDAARVEARVWGAVTDLLSQPERLTAMAADYLAMRGQQMTTERDQVRDIDARITKLERSLRETVIDYAREGVPAEVVRSATEALTGELNELRRHRAQLARWRATNADTSATVRRLWELAETAHERLGGMDDADKTRVLDLLDVSVTLTGTQECPECGAVGRLGGRRGGMRCPRCQGLRSLVALHVEGTIPDTLGDRLSSPVGDGEDFARITRAVPWPSQRGQEQKKRRQQRSRDVVNPRRGQSGTGEPGPVSTSPMSAWSGVRSLASSVSPQKPATRRALTASVSRTSTRNTRALPRRAPLVLSSWVTSDMRARR